VSNENAGSGASSGAAAGDFSGYTDARAPRRDERNESVSGHHLISRDVADPPCYWQRGMAHTSLAEMAGALRYI